MSTFLSETTLFAAKIPFLLLKSLFSEGNHPKIALAQHSVIATLSFAWQHGIDCPRCGASSPMGLIKLIPIAARPSTLTVF